MAFNMSVITFYLLMVFVAVLETCEGSTLLCPPKVKSFSHGSYSSSYYSCGKEGDVPVLKNCPNDQIYWALKEICSVKKMQNAYLGRDSESETYSDEVQDEGKHSTESQLYSWDLLPYSEPVLGRSVYLGSLVDAKRNYIFSEYSLWKEDTIMKNKRTSISLASTFKVFSAHTTYERLSHTDYQESLKLDLLGGLISPQGSAGYLKHTPQSESEVTVILNVRYTTRTETLSALTKKDYEMLCLQGGSTHVVTAITYGIETNILFQKNAAANESKGDIAKSLTKAVRFILSYKVKGDKGIHSHGKLNKTIENVYVKLFGDFLSANEPTTIEESAIVYKNLLSHLGEAPAYPNAVKLNMRLTPIKRFCHTQFNMLVGISNNVLHSVLIMLDELEKTKIKANALLTTDSVNRIPALKMVINAFINKFDMFNLKLRADLQILIPNIRMGNSSETGLIELITNYTRSPFNYASCNKFLQTRQHETEMIDYIINPERFQDTDVQILNYEHTNIFFKKSLILILKFNILPDLTIVNEFLQGKHVDECKSWFYSTEIISRIGKQLKAFIQLASGNRLSVKHGYLLEMYRAEKQEVNVCAQIDGKVVSSNFSFPQLPSTLTKYSNTYNSISFSIKNPDNIWISGVLVKYWQHLRKEGRIEKTFTFTHENPTNILITGLSPNQKYKFEMQYVTIMGNSPTGPESLPISTRPCSIPTNLRVGDLASTSFSILWDLPFYIGIGSHIVNYEVTVEQHAHIIRRTTTSGKRFAVFNELSSASEFMVYIRANTQNGTGEQIEKAVSLKALLLVITKPNPPSTVNLVSISCYSAVINWQPPTRIAVGAILLEYHIKYVMMNNVGNKTTLGSEMITKSRNKPYASIQNLIQGTTYAISVQVSTTLGSSIYSPVLIIRTSFNQTELQTLRISVEDKINHHKDNVDHAIMNIESELKGLHSNVDHIESELKGTFQYPQYRARFIGHGSSNRDNDVRKYAENLDECISWCYAQRQSDRKFDGVNYLSDRQCFCHRGDKMGTKFDKNWLHYRYY